MNSNVKTIWETLQTGSRILDAAHDLQQPPRRLCELLLCSILACRPLDLYTRMQEHVDAGVGTLFHAGLRRLADGEPLQYVTGTAFFMERPFRTDPRALIPRPETEMLVRAALACDALWKPETAPRILDFGTGSGCIAISLALERPRGLYFGVDRSAAAIDLAAENARIHAVGKQLKLLLADGLAAIAKASLDAVVTNPPYIATPDYHDLPGYIRDFEPREALDGGPDGLNIIKTLAGEAFHCLRPDGWMFIEIGHGQLNAVQRLLKQAGFDNRPPIYDMAGFERVVTAQKPSPSL